MKTLVVLAFVAIIASLGVALFFMLKHKDSQQSAGKKMATALAFRVGLSIALFVCILLAWKLGLVQPTGIPAGQ